MKPELTLAEKLAREPTLAPTWKIMGLHGYLQLSRANSKKERAVPLRIAQN